MKFPDEIEFLESFGLEPIEFDLSMSYYRYIKKSKNGLVELDISFNAISSSFQVVLINNGREISVCSSENVCLLEIRNTRKGFGIHVIFEINGQKSEVEVTLEPDLHVYWWLIEQ